MMGELLLIALEPYREKKAAKNLRTGVKTCCYIYTICILAASVQALCGRYRK